MPRNVLTDAEVNTAMHNLGNYRVLRAQTVASEGFPDGVSGALLLALGLRETALRNIEGGATILPDGTWVPQTDPKLQDVGWTQISRHYHADSLKLMPGVATGTWGPVVAGKTANDGGFVPRFTDSLRYTIDELDENISQALDLDVPEDQAVRVAIAAHNAGFGGAIHGYHEGNVDKYTAHGDYSEWVLFARTQVNHYLLAHPNWKA